MNRYVAFPVAVASDGSSTHEILRDTNGRPWPAGPAPEPPSTGAITDASTPRADGLRGGSVDPNGRVHPIDDAGQESRGGGLYARTGPTGAPRPSERRHASPIVWSTPRERQRFPAQTRYWRGTGLWADNVSDCCPRACSSELSKSARRQGWCSSCVWLLAHQRQTDCSKQSLARATRRRPEM